MEPSMLLKNQWYVAAMPGEIGRDLRQRWICGEPLVLYRTAAGEAVALGDRCPHRKFALSLGTLVGDEVQCGYHGFRFDCAGRCTHIPAQTGIPPRLNARRYPTVERHGWVWVWMGAADAADPALISDYHWNEAPGWKPVWGYLHLKADYRLVLDNLLDLTHETFVHPTSIGEAAVADTPMTTKVEGEKVTVTRLMNGCPAPPLFRRIRGLDRIDRWQRITFEAPAHIKIDAGGVPADTKDERRQLRWMVLNALTPETPTTTHYFWSVSRCFELEDEAISKILQAQITRIFEEDRLILETQQKLIDSDASGRPLMSLNIDAGSAAARRIIDTLGQREQAGGQRAA
jgi:phenylpropionate dioxygenase-like ring-hydroxylating dioxygenase large terminal subunit